MYKAPVVRVNVTEGSALGAAILAAVGAGEFKSVPQACAAIIKPVDGLKPNVKMVRLHERGHKIFQRLYFRLKPEFPELAGGCELRRK